MMMTGVQSVECELTGESEVVGENLPQKLATRTLKFILYMKKDNVIRCTASGEYVNKKFFFISSQV
jgi:hypothetical protein